MNFNMRVDDILRMKKKINAEVDGYGSHKMQHKVENYVNESKSKLRKEKSDTLTL